MVPIAQLVFVALLIVGAACEDDLDFKLQLVYDAMDSSLDKPQVNRLVISAMRILSIDSKDTAAIDSCWAKGNKDINTMRVCFTDSTGISVDGVCNKEGIEKYLDSRMGHLHGMFRDFAADLLGCSCYKKASYPRFVLFHSLVRSLVDIPPHCRSTG
ncbi:hypothetical protein V5799_030983 [Amblyomma americanum]|uniref:Secreted protein n=1 Tax=Amblyomma americanum TaxID=6943 RepID=A0AAQ4EMK8_AMBAM